MYQVFALFTVIILTLTPNYSFAAEGSSVAGIAGGSDMRSALLPPPGVYVAGIAASGQSEDFFDGKGNAVPLLDGLKNSSQAGAFALLYVPEFKLAGGSFGLLGTVSRARECGRLFAWTSSRCTTGWGDPYVEASWSRFYGTIRPSQYAGAFPIAEGLAVQFGIGAVIPDGHYNAGNVAKNGIAIGNNVWDIAPMAAFTYTSPPMLAEATEISAKLYWNNYRENRDTNYQQGDLLSIDFALTERIGLVQFGVAGLYAEQIEDDEKFGIAVSPDGRRAKGLSLGPVVAIDLPALAASLKIKLQKSVIKQNATDGSAVLVTYGMKIF